jgi:hypothetical protein
MRIILWVVAKVSWAMFVLSAVAVIFGGYMAAMNGANEVNGVATVSCYASRVSSVWGSSVEPGVMLKEDESEPASLQPSIRQSKIQVREDGRSP